MTRHPRADAEAAAHPSPVILSAETLRAIAHDALEASSADTMSVQVHHVATGSTRVSEHRGRLTNSGDTLTIDVVTRWGTRGAGTIVFNQIDPDSIRDAVQYAERIAREQYGDLAPLIDVMPIPPRKFGPSTVWHDRTADAMVEERQTIVPTLLQPMFDAKLRAAAFIGVYAHAKMYANKQGLFSMGKETDAEMTVTGWDARDTGTLGGPGWAGQAARDWAMLDPTRVGTEAAKLSVLAANPVAYEPGRRLTILGRPAVAQMVRAIGQDYGAYPTHMQLTPLSGLHIGEKVVDERIDLTSDPNDPDGGYLPANDNGYPLTAMSWLTRGRLANLAYDPYYAASSSIPVPNDPPTSLRMQAASGPLLSVEEMIANAKEAIYVNRVTDIKVIHWRSGLMTGVTQGGCFLVHNGKIEKAVKNFRFVESMYFILNRLVAIGTSERTAFGYSPWHGEWPIAPTIVPPLMIRDFNFVALAEAV